MLKKICFVGAFATVLGACSHVDEYERQVHDWAPVYCYQTIGNTQCYREPKHADARRLVNYYGPHPSRYDAPPPPPAPNLKAPEPVNYWVKDPEPVPRPSPKGDMSDRPWLSADGRDAAKARVERNELEQSNAGTRALLRRIDDAAAGNSPDAVPDLDLPAPDTEVR